MEKINRNNIPDNFYSITQLKEVGLRPVDKTPKYFTYNQHGKLYYLYDITETIKVKKRIPTEKQLKALEEGRRLRKVCKICSNELNYIHELDSYKICYRCNNTCDRFLQEYREIYNIRLFKRFLDNKNKYVILDTETTGLEEYDQVIELSIIDLAGITLFDSKFNPTIKVSKGAENIHGLSNEILSSESIWIDKWEEIKAILKDKTVLIYNSSFDCRLIKQTCRAFDVEYTQLNTECIMKLYSEYIDYNRWVSLENAYGVEVGDIVQSHRALSDCHMVLELIKSIANRKQIIDKDIKDTAYKVLELKGTLKIHEDMFK